MTAKTSATDRTTRARLNRVRRARAGLERARAEYRAALVAARAAGIPVPTIAAAAGITRQATYKLTRERTS